RRVERKQTTIDLRAGLPKARRELIVGQLEQPPTGGRGRAHEAPFPAHRDVTPRPGAARAELDGRDGLVRERMDPRAWRSVAAPGGVQPDVRRVLDLCDLGWERVTD